MPSAPSDPSAPPSGEVSSEPVGALAACWRYPVKSFQGLSVDELTIGHGGADGDRTFGLIDVATGRLMSAKRTAVLLTAAATDTTMTLPDGTEVAVDDPEVDKVLSAWLDRDVRLARAQDEGAVSYQMTFDPPDDDAEVFDIPTPEGTFLDLAAVHLLTTATLDGCAAARPDLDWDVRRFRPTLLVDAEGEMLLEQTWIGGRVQVGDDLVLSIDQPTVRCAMPLRAQPGGLDRQPDLFRALNELNAAAPNHLGVYCSVVSPGVVRPGDPVTVLSR